MNLRESRVVFPIAICLAIAAVSTASILIRLAQRDAPSITIAALRLTFAATILAPLALVRHRGELRTLRPKQWFLACLAGAFLALHFGTWISSLAYTTVASSVVLVSTGPLWVALLSPALLGERPTRSTAVGLIFAIAGGIVIGAGDACSWEKALECNPLTVARFGGAAWGNFLALVGAWSVTGYLILGRRIRPTLSLVPYVFLVYGFAAVFLLAMMFAGGHTGLGLPPTTYIWLLLLAIGPQLIGHSTYNWALRFLPAAVVAVTTLGEPIGSAILAVFILNEKPGPPVLVGGSLILGGIYMAARGTRISEARAGQ